LCARLDNIDMFEDIKGKRVLVTGASGGMGSEIVKLFAEHGARLGLHYFVNKEEAIKLLEEVRGKNGEAEIFQADLRNEEEGRNLIKLFVGKFEGIDVLVNNAGAVYDYKHFSELDEKSFRDTFDLNVKAPFCLMKEAFPHMKEQGGGRIVNLSSVNVKYGGSAKSMHYVAAKAALENLTLGFAKEGAEHNILVNTVRCGVIDTPMRTRIAGYSEEDFQKRINLVPLKRAGKPQDIARMVLFLAAETGNFITGEIFTVAGGD